MSDPRLTRLAQLRTLRDQIDAEIDRLITQVAIARLTIVEPWPRVAQCGTDGGYYRHRRTLGETACRPCRDAHAAAERDRAGRRRAGAA